MSPNPQSPVESVRREPEVHFWADCLVPAGPPASRPRRSMSSSSPLLIAISCTAVCPPWAWLMPGFRGITALQGGASAGAQGVAGLCPTGKGSGFW